jgi:hypothetical protein
MVEPNQSAVVSRLFGKYVGTVKTPACAEQPILSKKNHNAFATSSGKQ